jgi:hypothetical protein
MMAHRGIFGLRSARERGAASAPPDVDPASNRIFFTMAKSQKRSNREVRKPKAAKSKPSVGLQPLETSPVLAATRKQRDRM